MNKYLKLTIIIISLLLTFFLFYQYFAIGKNVSYTSNFRDESSRITNFYPEGRAKNPEMNLKTGEKYQRIVNEPVYFDVFLTNFFGRQIFDKVIIDLAYKNKNQNIIELGLRKDYRNENNWAFEFQPLQNKIIDEFDGIKIASDYLILLQKQNNFKSIDEFLQNLPLDKKIMTYNYKLAYDFKIKNYVPSTKSYKFDYPLFGGHTFMFYKGDENAEFNFIVQKNIDTQEQLNFQIINQNGEILVNKVWSDGAGNEKQKTFTLKLDNAAIGLYSLKINASDNFVIENIKTSQIYFVIQNRVNFAMLNQPANIYTIAPETYAIAKSTNGFQTITINNDKVAVYDLEEKSAWPENKIADIKDLQTIKIPRGEVIINNDGFFVFNRENYFNPQMTMPIKYYNSNDDFDYLIAKNYVSPSRTKKVYHSSLTFDLTNLAGKTEYLNFILSAPGIAKSNGDIAVFKIKVELIRKPFSFGKLKGYLNKTMGFRF